MLYQLSHPAAPDYKNEVSNLRVKRKRGAAVLFGCMAALQLGLQAYGLANELFFTWGDFSTVFVNTKTLGKIVCL